MSGLDGDDAIRRQVDAIYRHESRRILATLIRLLGDFDLAEEALHEAFRAAVEQWPADGVPDNPRAWLVSAGRFKTIDTLRRRARFDAAQDEIARRLHGESRGPAEQALDEVGDDHLRLVFTCCHPALPHDARIALTLREVCGLTTEQIARAYMAPVPTIAQRIVRAKQRIRDQAIAYAVPTQAELPDRLASVLQVIYLVFNEGYTASDGDQWHRHELAAEAIRLARELLELLPDAEVMGLLALMLLHQSRRQARLSPDGELVRLADQDRSRWDRACILEGKALVRRAFATGEIGSYTLQAAIAAEHALPATAAQTDWARIVSLYDVLLKADPSPVAELNRATAVAVRDGAEAGLALIDGLLARGELADYHLAHAARAELLRQLDRDDEARGAWQRALALARQAPERRYLEHRLAELPR